MSGIVLASASPRRKELLEAAGVVFQIVPSRAEEVQGTEDSPEQVARVNAQRKAREVAPRVEAEFVIGADTIVVVDGAVLGKPADRAEAARMIQRLQGREHAVLTGVAVLHVPTREMADTVERTTVRFGPLSDVAQVAYMATFDPLDKAGAYVIQGPGALVIEAVAGCYYNVVGLPLNALERLFLGFGRSLLCDPAFRRRAD